MKTNANNKLLIYDKKWSYHCSGEGIPCLVIGMSPLYQFPPTSGLTHRLKFIFTSLYWEKEHPDFDVTTLTMHDLACDIDETRKQLGYDKIAVLAHSALGLIALEYALTYPQHNLFNVIIGTPLSFNENYIQERDTFFQKDASSERKEILKQNLVKFEQQKPQLSKDQIFVAEYMAKTPMYWFNPHHDCSHDWEQINFNDMMRTQYFEKILPDYNKKEQYQNITVPIFLALGRYDYAVPYTTLDFVKNLKNFSYNLFMHSAHYPMPEEQELFNQKLLQWLDKIAP